MSGTELMGKVKRVVIGGARSPHDPAIFHKISLMAFFAWIGLGADGLSSSCYGPEEAFRELMRYPHLAIIVGVISAITIFIIAASYNQIVELFPSGGGGYLVASKLLSPNIGMISGCALLVDYILTISLSVSSGVDALFSFLPTWLLDYKLEAALFGVLLLIVLNMRGVKESVIPLVPIFLIFLATHAFSFIYAIVTHAGEVPRLVAETSHGFHSAVSEIGLLGTIILIMKAYSMGAGTYTGIEAVSNGLPILRDPKVHTARKTMRYMAISLAATVVGLMIVYVLYRVQPSPDMSKTLNAIFLENMTQSWPATWGHAFVWITLFSEATLLLVAAQTGFLDGPRVLANMALDRWFPTKFAMLSNRLVTQNGILFMGVAAFLTVLLSRGQVRFLVVLYSINVFVTFALSQLGMVRHWWGCRGKAEHWRKRLFINGVGLSLTLFILVSVVIIKFHEGGWITIFVTGSLVLGVTIIKRHYLRTAKLLHKLNHLVADAAASSSILLAKDAPAPAAEPDLSGRTAVLMVNGYNGLGLHTLFNMVRLFQGTFQNYVFVQVGMVDAGNFKGVEEMSKLDSHIKAEVDRYVAFMRNNGFYAEGFTAVGNDVIHETLKLAPRIQEKFPNAVFFGGQLVFPEDTFLSRWLHNYITFALQRRFYHQGTPFIILPVRV